MDKLQLNYEEAQKLAINSKWKTKECAQKDCWCVIVVPETPIKYKIGDGLEDEYYIISSGEVSRELGERIVNDHNKLL